MSYQIKISKRSIKAARFISRLQAVIQKAFVESGLTQQEVAERLGVDRSVVNRRLKGKANLTARTIADFAFILDKDIHFDFLDKEEKHSCNWVRTAAIEETLPLVGKNAKNSQLSATSGSHIHALSPAKHTIERVEA